MYFLTLILARKILIGLDSNSKGKIFDSLRRKFSEIDSKLEMAEIRTSLFNTDVKIILSNRYNLIEQQIDLVSTIRFSKGQ